MPAKGQRPLPDLRCDHHVHTRFCGHAEGEMEEYVQAAIRHGLRKIVFLEHMEEGIVSSYRTWLSEEDFDRYFSEGRRLQEKYDGEIEVKLGVECGYNGERAGILRNRLARRNWDEIGLSCHFLALPGMPEHLNMFSRKAGNVELAGRFNPEWLLDRYFHALHEAVLQLPGTFVCHLDGALRHVPGIALSSRHYMKIGEILETLKEKRMALEINTSGIAIRGEPFPARRLLSMARDLGIPLLLSSDAHRPTEVARHFGEVSSFIP